MTDECNRRPAAAVLALVMGVAAFPARTEAGTVFILSDEDGRRADVELSLIDETTLEVRVRNRSGGPGDRAPDLVLTGVSWDFGVDGVAKDDPVITGGRVVIGPESRSINFDTGDYGPGTDVSGEWGFGNRADTGLLPNFLTTLDRAATRLEGENLDGPVELAGPQGGLIARDFSATEVRLGVIEDEIVATLDVRPRLPSLSFLVVHGVRVEFGDGAALVGVSGGFVFDDPEEIRETREPTAVGTADFDGARGNDIALTVIDESPDGSGVLEVLLNDGTGLAYTPVITGVGAGPSDVAIDDFDRVDGPDAAVPDAVDDTVTILLNDGTGRGTFSTPVTIPVGRAPSAAAAGDLDGDDAPELAVANAGDDTVTILRNDGAGRFTPDATPLDVGAAPADVSFGDFDGDGRLDLLVTNGGDGNVMFFINDGTGGLVLENVEETGRAPCFGEPEDLDNDKDIDAIVANDGFPGPDTGQITVLVNEGDGVFTRLIVPVGQTPTGVAIEDLDVDGDADIVVVAGAGPERSIRAFRNMVNETGELALRFTTAVDFDPGQRLVDSDRLDPDGLPDLVTVDVTPDATGRVGVLLGVRGCRADLNGNGSVGRPDLGAVLENWGACADPCPPTCTFDLDGDCMVAMSDVLVVLRTWGPCP